MQFNPGDPEEIEAVVALSEGQVIEDPLKWAVLAAGITTMVVANFTHKGPEDRMPDEELWASFRVMFNRMPMSLVAAGFESAKYAYELAEIEQLEQMLNNGQESQ